MQTKIDIIKLWFEQVWCEPRNPDIMDELLAKDAKLYGVNPEAPLDTNQFKGIRDFFIAKYPDIHIEVTHAFEADDMAAFHAEVTGTHQESGNQVKFNGTALVKFDGNLIVESRETWDFTTMLVQNGTLTMAMLDGEIAPL